MCSAVTSVSLEGHWYDFNNEQPVAVQQTYLP